MATLVMSRISRNIYWQSGIALIVLETIRVVKIEMKRRDGPKVGDREGRGSSCFCLECAVQEGKIYSPQQPLVDTWWGELPCNRRGRCQW